MIYLIRMANQNNSDKEGVKNFTLVIRLEIFFSYFCGFEKRQQSQRHIYIDLNVIFGEKLDLVPVFSGYSLSVVLEPYVPFSQWFRRSAT